jgi:L-fuconolactonase
MVSEADWKHWTPKDFNPYLDIVLNAFGHDRVMIGSDWPVCTITGTYSEVMGIVIDYIKTLSESEQEAILGGNCERFYLENEFGNGP